MGRKRKGYPISGWVNLLKPVGIGSTQAVSIVRGVARAAKAGHAGTLDPSAEGILPIALGEATKTIPWVQSRRKTYEVTISWGRATTTDDAEGETVASSPNRPSLAEITALLPNFIGTISQRPPQVSAVHINGQRAYDLVRRGETPEIKSRDVTIYAITCLEDVDPANPSLGDRSAVETTRLEVVTGKGVYIRSLARDLGEQLGCFGHVTCLKRTQCGNFSLEDAISLDAFRALAHKEATLSATQVISALRPALLPISAGLDDIPVWILEERQARKLASGLAIPRSSGVCLERPHREADAGRQENACERDDTRNCQTSLPQREEICIVQSSAQDVSESSSRQALHTSLNDWPIAIARLTPTEIVPLRVFNTPPVPMVFSGAAQKPTPDM